jgi:hypothetical protein
MPIRVPEELRAMRLDRGLLVNYAIKVAEDAHALLNSNRTHEIGVRLTLHE